ncbi:PH domain-containing protein [Mobilicoccus pelagius]|uniref:Low molecular weight protein antigen 6 PH domain-containing protein n=1 Tax=Mobilicoccus pelagius NBRC 104925 TaxID=1089455 RepID=H5UUY9_9MICO|nr:PH domain-containing protein [Mobilicoccus pelagius]GAB49547.1 hypothetical protein MOPEL_130_01540 [Mobilicoccus pelagius NBRC 104925]
MSTSSESNPSPRAEGARAGAAGRARPRRDPYAVIRPRRGRVVPVVAAALVFVTFTLSAVIVPGQAAQKGDWAISDRLLMFLMGVAIAWFLLRFAQIRAVPTREGLAVRNLLITRELEWAEIVHLQFGGGSPWAYLDTADFETVPLMAVQKADGEFGRAEAARLAALIDYHSAREPEPASSMPPATAADPHPDATDAAPHDPDLTGSDTSEDDGTDTFR